MKYFCGILIALTICFIISVEGLLNCSELPWNLSGSEFSNSGMVPPLFLYRFSNGSGSIVTDDSGNNMNGVLSGIYSWVSGRTGGYAIRFNGGSDYCLTPSSGDLLNALTQTSLVIWVKFLTVPSSGTPILIEHYSNGVWMRYDSGTTLACFLNLGTTASPSWEPGLRYTWTPTVGTWYHIAATFNGTSGACRLYVNGVLQNSQTRTGTITATTDGYRIANGLNVEVDEVEVYNYELSQTDIQAHYNGLSFGYSNKFSEAMSYVSKANDCGETVTFGKITASYSAASGCSVTFNTRVSADGQNWGSWSTPVSSGEEIPSSPARYIQFRLNAGIPAGATGTDLIVINKVKVGSPIKAVTSAPSHVLHSGDNMVLSLDFDISMNTTKCAVDLIRQAGDTVAVNSAAQGSWSGSVFTTAGYAVTPATGDGFAGLRVKSGVTTSGNPLYVYLPSLLLIDSYEFASTKTEFFPNPFSPNGDGKADETTIMFSLNTAANVTCRIFNFKGALVKTLLENIEIQGISSVSWNGKDGTGKAVPIGLYIYQLKMGTETKTGTVVVTK